MHDDAWSSQLSINIDDLVQKIYNKIYENRQFTIDRTFLYEIVTDCWTYQNLFLHCLKNALWKAVKSHWDLDSAHCTDIKTAFHIAEVHTPPKRQKISACAYALCLGIWKEVWLFMAISYWDLTETVTQLKTKVVAV